MYLPLQPLKTKSKVQQSLPALSNLDAFIIQ